MGPIECYGILMLFRVVAAKMSFHLSIQPFYSPLEIFVKTPTAAFLGRVDFPYVSVSLLFPPSLSISYVKNCHILSQNVEYGTFVANVTKNLTYALGGNNSG